MSQSVEALAAAFRQRVDHPSAESFILQAAQDAAPDELPELPPESLAELLADFWRFAEHRPDSGPSLRIVPVEGAPGLDRLEIVQADAPFLVDSVMGEVAEQGLSVRAMFHPVVRVARDVAGWRMAEGAEKPESMIQVIVEHVGGDREQAVLAGVQGALADLRSAVDDFPAMLDLMGRTIAELQAQPAVDPAHADTRREELAFLEWLRDEHFVYLGARVYAYPRLANGDYAAEEPLFQPEDGLGVLRDPARAVLRRSSEPAVLSAQIRNRLSDPAVMVAKSNVRSRVHRRGYMDYVGVKRFGEDGRPSGEIRFVGLFTAEAYDKPANEVPLIRAKLDQVLRRARAHPGGHSEKRLRNILENYPRDELFQATEEDLLVTSEAILHLYDRPRVRLFERRDPYDRFASVLMFVPRERYDSDLRARAGDLLAQAYGGRVSAYYPYFSDAPLARVHFIIGFTPGDHLTPDLREVEAQVAQAARTWTDRFADAVRASGRSTAQVGDLLARYGQAFPPGYRDAFPAAEALADLAVIETLARGDPLRVRAYRRPEDSATQFRFKLYRPGAPAPLADVLPILENMGLKAMVELGLKVSPAQGGPVWIHDFELLDEQGAHLVFDEVKTAFEDAFTAVWTGRTENDGFNRLVLELSVSWRDAALIRALARYRQQSGLDPSQRVQEAALSAHPGVTRLILDLFRTRFHPGMHVDLAARQAQSQAVMAEIVEALQLVESLDHDRVLRRIALLTQALQRTNYYQPNPDGSPKAHISFKVASSDLADLPLPRPYREIFVWATHVEGIHLRFGPVARGGLRWSDRRDDFRTEVLGLAKAQQVKNAVIVPVGSKGGFYPKLLPKGGTPAEVRAEGVRAYTTFLQGLLDITDNLTPEGAVEPPEHVVVHDGDDPYLVVAADKGTATFSDIANGIAQSYGFWLDDAFASGGSAGYDHKVMGITARGAWEAVKRHFRELGKDIQSEPFTVVGVGDMSGDVFGNGMLLSRHTRLVAAFDHRHIFLDPNPDTAASYGERTRMFALPGSSWDDYDRTKLSRGGGVFARTLKQIPLTAEVRALLGVETEVLAPAELMSAILKAPADLLYLGGIGTYVKASAQTHAEVGDKGNDGLRVNAVDLRVKVVGEGANLGLTQAARIEFAARGGRINTDAIDNSAGVDSSDHEVNIKIATGALERTRVLTRGQRDALLKSMTDDVAAHVLRHNYDQTLGLSLLDLDAPGDLDANVRFMTALEARGRLDRAVEGLPDGVQIAERRNVGRGLTRPETAVLMAYGKLELSQEIAASAAIDDPHFEAVLEGYFPRALRAYGDVLRRHRLRREIVATVVANDVVNRCGPTFPGRLMEAAGCNIRAFISAYESAKVIHDLPKLWSEVAALDADAPDTVPTAGQMALFRSLADSLRSAVFWLARRALRHNLGVDALITRYAAGAAALARLGGAVLSPVETQRVQAHVARLTGAGAPRPLALRVATLSTMTTDDIDLVDLSEAAGWELGPVAHVHHEAGRVFAFDRLRTAAAAFRSGDGFERMAVRRLQEDLLTEQAAVSRAIMDHAGTSAACRDAARAHDTVAAWASGRAAAAEAARRTVEDIEAAGGSWTFAKLTIANSALRELLAESRS